MPETDVIFYRADGGSVPVLEWLDELHQDDRRAYNKCVEVIERLAAFGHELRRPTADLLERGIYELRTRRTCELSDFVFLSWPATRDPGSRTHKGAPSRQRTSRPQSQER